MSANNPPRRDVLDEARSWREHLRPGNPLIVELAEVGDETLAQSYMTWWRIYTREIRNAPSSRSPHGVASSDAAAAGRLATEAVLDSLRAPA